MHIIWTLLIDYQLWELVTGECLASVTFPKPVASIAMDLGEQFLFAGSSSGEVYKLNMHEKVDRLTDPTQPGSTCVTLRGHT